MNASQAPVALQRILVEKAIIACRFQSSIDDRGGPGRRSSRALQNPLDLLKGVLFVRLCFSSFSNEPERLQEFIVVRHKVNF
jgi:hypothetical protein